MYEFKSSNFTSFFFSVAVKLRRRGALNSLNFFNKGFNPVFNPERLVFGLILV